MDRLNAMTIFTRVVEIHSFKGAADALLLPASTVTKIIKDLETYLGVRLLNRTTRQLSLTSEGSAYYVRCKSILSDVDIAEAAIATQGERIHGMLRVEMIPSLARLYLIPNLAAFRGSYPDIEITLTTSDRVIDLVQDGVDCVIRAGIPQTSATLVARQLATFEWVMCASGDYLATNGQPNTVDDLRNHRAVGYLSNRTGRTTDWEFLEAGKYPSIKMIEPIVVNDTDGYLAAGLAGLGLIRCASYMVAPYLADGRLVRILKHVPVPSEPLAILYPKNAHLSPKVRVFIDWCVWVFAEFSGDWNREIEILKDR